MVKYIAKALLLFSLLIFLLGCLGGDSAGPVDTVAPIVTEAPVSAGGLSELARTGEALFRSKQCSACHTIDGRGGTGPTLKGLLGSTVTLIDGSSVSADEAYLRESISTPNAKIVEGYSEGVMASFVPPGSLSDDEINALVAYIKTL